MGLRQILSRPCSGAGGGLWCAGQRRTWFGRGGCYKWRLWRRVQLRVWCISTLVLLLVFSLLVLPSAWHVWSLCLCTSRPLSSQNGPVSFLMVPPESRSLVVWSPSHKHDHWLSCLCIVVMYALLNRLLQPTKSAVLRWRRSSYVRNVLFISYSAGAVPVGLCGVIR